MDAVNFVLAFYSLEPDNSIDMDIMFKLGNEYLALVLEQSHDHVVKQRLVESIGHHLSNFIKRTLEYLDNFWLKAGYKSYYTR